MGEEPGDLEAVRFIESHPFGIARPTTPMVVTRLYSSKLSGVSARRSARSGIQGLYRRRTRGCTIRNTADQPAEDLVNRKFTVDGPNRLWLTDITEHPTDEGKLYCAAVMDAYSRRIIGWSIDNHMHTELVIDALGMATLRRKPESGNTILHSDHGSQVHRMSLRAATLGRRNSSLHGQCGRLLRHFHDGIVLGQTPTRSTRH